MLKGERCFGLYLLLPNNSSELLSPSLESFHAVGSVNTKSFRLPGFSKFCSYCSLYPCGISPASVENWKREPKATVTTPMICEKRLCIDLMIGRGRRALRTFRPS